jgi:hypothetical protein
MRKDMKNIADTLINSNKILFLVAISISFSMTIIVSYRLKLLMRGQKIYLALKDCVYLTFIGFFFNNFLPTAIGGDIAKAHYASKKTNNKTASYAAVLCDRLVGFLACLTLALIGIILVGNEFKNSSITWAICGMVVFFTLAILILLSKKDSRLLKHPFTQKGLIGKIREKMSKLYSAINYYKHHKHLLLKSYLLTIFIQGCTVVSIYFLILCLGGSINIFKLFFIIPLVWTVSMLPSLNGLGVREGAFVYFLKGDIGKDMGFSVSLLWLGMVLFYGIIGGVLHMIFPVKVGIPKD